jgi:hypothetical protein
VKKLILLIVPILGCGNGAPNAQYQPPLAKLHGAITSSLVPPSELEVALFWAQMPGGPTLAGQQVGISSQFPAQFQIDVSQLPPDGALQQLTNDQAARDCWSAKTRVAYGTLVVYADLDRDGLLTLRPAESTACTDMVLGGSSEAIVYVEGDKIAGCTPSATAPLLGPQLQPGYNLVDLMHQILLPLSTEIQVSLNYNALQKQLWNVTHGGDIGRDPSLVCRDPSCYPPAGVQVICSVDNTAFAYAVSPISFPTCGFGFVGGPLSGTSPAQWPCPSP